MGESILMIVTHYSFITNKFVYIMYIQVNLIKFKLQFSITESIFIYLAKSITYNWNIMKWAQGRGYQ